MYIHLMVIKKKKKKEVSRLGVRSHKFRSQDYYLLAVWPGQVFPVLKVFDSLDVNHLTFLVCFLFYLKEIFCPLSSNPLFTRRCKIPFSFMY